MCKMSVYQTCQPLVKENLETHEKNLEILQKIVRFYFSVPDQTPFPSRELDTNLQIDAENKSLNSSKNHSSVQKSNKYRVFLY